MYVSIYKYLICLYICLFICLCICIDVLINLYIDVHSIYTIAEVFRHILVHICRCIYCHVHLSMNVINAIHYYLFVDKCLYTSTYRHIYAYIYVYIDIYGLIYTHVYIDEYIDVHRRI